MRFADPAGLIHLELRAGWALDPLSSTLFQRAFSQWASSNPRRLFVHLDPSASRGTDDDWVRRTVASLPHGIPQHEVTGSSRGPIVWVVRPGREGRPHQRWAIVRGRSADLTVEEVGVPLGGPVRTPTLLAAVSSVQAPVNDVAWESPPGTWNELMDEADAATGAGDLDRAVDRLLAAHNWALRSWLHSVLEGSVVSRFAIAAAQSRLSLAALQRDVTSLAETVELTHRLSGFVDDGAEGIEGLRSRLFSMCGQAAGQPPPHETWQAHELVTGALLEQVVAQGTAGDPAHRRESAETAMRLSASSLLVSRLLHGRPEDREALVRLEDRALGRLVAAGSAYQAALWGTAQLSPSGVAEEWLSATRLLRSRHPADESLVPVLLSALNAAAGASARVGDPDAVEREEALLAEARDLVGDRPDDPLHDRVWLLSAWASVHGRRPEEALERSARITATDGDLGRSRASVRATALRLLGRKEEELAEARRAVGEDDPSDSMHRVVPGPRARLVRAHRRGRHPGAARAPVGPR